MCTSCEESSCRLNLVSSSIPHERNVDTAIQEMALCDVMHTFSIS